MNDDNKKIMILGMGLVGNSLLSLLVREQLLRAEDIVWIEDGVSTVLELSIVTD